MKKKESSPEKFNNRRAVIQYPFENGGHCEVFLLDEGESLPMNSSTNYDHHYFGSGMIIINHTKMNTVRNESWANDFEAWDMFDWLINLGCEKLEGMTQEEVDNHKEAFIEKRNQRQPRISVHDKKAKV